MPASDGKRPPGRKTTRAKIAEPRRGRARKAGQSRPPARRGRWLRENKGREGSLLVEDHRDRFVDRRARVDMPHAPSVELEHALPRATRRQKPTLVPRHTFMGAASGLARSGTMALLALSLSPRGRVDPAVITMAWASPGRSPQAHHMMPASKRRGGGKPRNR